MHFNPHPTYTGARARGLLALRTQMGPIRSGRSHHFASATLAETLHLLENLFAENADVVQWVRSRGGMTAFPWLKNETSARALCEAATQEGVLLVPAIALASLSNCELDLDLASDFEVSVTALAQCLRRVVTMHSHRTCTPTPLQDRTTERQTGASRVAPGAFAQVPRRLNATRCRWMKSRSKFRISRSSLAVSHCRLELWRVL
jgi:hypothetical protein